MARVSHQHKHPESSRRTVGVYDRPPQKRSTKPILIALVIALAVVLTFLFVRFSHGSPAQSSWEGYAIGVPHPGFSPAVGVNASDTR